MKKGKKEECEGKRYFSPDGRELFVDKHETGSFCTMYRKPNGIAARYLNRKLPMGTSFSEVQTALNSFAATFALREVL